MWINIRSINSSQPSQRGWRDLRPRISGSSSSTRRGQFSIGGRQSWTTSNGSTGGKIAGIRSAGTQRYLCGRCPRQHRMGSATNLGRENQRQLPQDCIQIKIQLQPQRGIPSAKSFGSSPQQMRCEIAGKRRNQGNWRTWSVRGWRGSNNWYSRNQQHSNIQTATRRAQTPPQPRTARAQHQEEDGVNKKKNKDGKVAALLPSTSQSLSPLIRRKRTISRRSHSRTNIGRDELKEKKNNPTGCKYCTKYGGKGLAHGPPNNSSHSKFNYNKKWTGWRPEWICKKSA